jgi:hypothetical protein
MECIVVLYWDNMLKGRTIAMKHVVTCILNKNCRLEMSMLEFLNNLWGLGTE